MTALELLKIKIAELDKMLWHYCNYGGVNHTYRAFKKGEIAPCLNYWNAPKPLM